MPTFIKTSYWEKVKKGYLWWLNLDDLIKSISKQAIPASNMTVSEISAIQNANTPSTNNPFATINDLPSVTYLEYSLFVSQTSTDAPTILSLLNTLGVVALTRSAVGIYTFLSNSLFTENKTIPNKINTTYDSAGNKITIEWTSATTLTLKTYNDVDVLTDGILDEQEINIKVYL